VEKWKLLDPTFNPKQVFVRSTPFSRTILSAQALLRAFYPELKKEDLGKIVTTNAYRYSPSDDVCPRLIDLHANTRSAEDFQAPLQTKDVLAARRDLEALVGTHQRTSSFWLPVSDNIKCVEATGERVNIPYTFAALIHRLALLEYWKEIISMDEIMRLSVGLLLHETLTQMDYIVHGKKSPSTEDLEVDHSIDRNQLKMMIYLAHDSTVVPMLKVLNIYDGEWPPFAANLIFHLSENKTKGNSEQKTTTGNQSDDDERWSVTVIVNNKPKTILSYKKFKSTIAPFCITDGQYIKQCHSKEKQPEILW